MDTMDLNFMDKSNIWTLWTKISWTNQTYGHYGLKFHGQIKHM